MTHEIDHIWCSGVGKILRWAVLVDGDRRIPFPVYERALANIVIVGKDTPHKDIEKATKIVENFRHKFFRTIAQPGDDVHYQTPHPPADHGGDV